MLDDDAFDGDVLPGDAAQGRLQQIEALPAAVADAKSDATIGWDASPITTARMCAEVHAQIKDEDWSLVGTSIRLSWPHKLWDLKKTYHWNGVSGGAGVGYNLPSSIGAALANKKHGRLTVAFGGDGDFMFVPSALWTAAHYRAGFLAIVLANGGYAIMDRLAERFGGRPPWPGFAEISVDGLAAALGCPTLRIGDQAKLLQVLDEVVPALASRIEPLVLVVDVDADSTFEP